MTRAALVLVAASLLACHASAPPAAPVARGPHAVYARVQAAEDLDGIAAARYFAAGEPTIFVVFASWCVHCRKELAVLTELRAAEPRVHVIGLNAYEEWEDASNESKLRAYLVENAPWLPVVRTDAAMLVALGGVPKIPSLFVFDGTGRLVQAWKRDQRGAPTLAELKSALASLLPAR